MKKDFKEMINRAVEIREKYSKNDLKQWEIEQGFMGMVKDVGDLSKLLMVNGGYRKDLEGDVKGKLEHELADVLYSLLVIADKIGIDLEKSFWNTMDDLDRRIDN